MLPVEADLRLEISEIEHGWMVVKLSAGGGEVGFDPSYLTDALGEFLAAVRDMLRSGRGVCVWAVEPGVYEWTLARDGTSLGVRVRYLANDDLWFSSNRFAHDPSQHEGQTLLEVSTRAVGFAREVAREVADVRDRYGVEYYESDWGMPFPDDALRELREAIADAERA